jgi:hypothetical protein
MGNEKSIRRRACLETKRSWRNVLAARGALPIYFAAVFNLYRKWLGGVLESDLLEPYERLIKIEVLGHMVEVPEKNRLLRCFQFLSLNTISYGDFCWNGECTNCQFWYHEAGQDENQDKTGLSCRFDVVEDMVVTRLSPHVEIEGINRKSNEDAS